MSATKYEMIGKHRRLDLRGQTFGDLVAQEPVGKTVYGTLWSCRCVCGQIVCRTATHLRQALSHGHRSACKDCHVTAPNKITVSYAIPGERVRILKELYARQGTIWTYTASKKLEAKVQKDLENAFGKLPETSYTDGTGVAFGERTPLPIRRQQRIAYLHPIAIESNEGYWECVDCKGEFSRGLGCTACIEPVCRDCVLAERHACLEAATDSVDGVHSLEETGAVFGLCRERARQIEQHALNKLRGGTIGKHTDTSLEDIKCRRDFRKVAREYWEDYL